MARMPQVGARELVRAFLKRHRRDGPTSAEILSACPDLEREGRAAARSYRYGGPIAIRML